MSSTDRLAELRRAIDAVDDELLALLNRRAALTIEVGEVKRADGGAPEFYRPEREAGILRRLTAANPGPMPDAELVRLMREIISTCLSLEQVLDVAYLGPAGTYTHAALRKHFGAAVNAVPAATIGEVFRAVESGACGYGVVPIENSVGGAVIQSLDCLAESAAGICAEIALPIHHQLLVRGTAQADVARVYAHEQALQQCRAWLANELPGAELIAVGSNAQAAERAAGEAGSAAIASVQAGEIYGLEVLAANIEDRPDNTTRFVVLGGSRPGPTGADRTSIMFSMPNQPGALHGILGVLAERGISMSRIESRPLRNGQWDYLFFVDLLGHADDDDMAGALAAIEGRAALFKVLGSYPRAVL
ncbi:MAG: prephenate dehydratase [Gammaproteobacteria bacterium]